MEDLAVKPRRFSRQHIAQMVRALMHKGHTARTLSIAMSVDESTARRWLRAFHDAEVIHVAGYAPVRNRAPQAPIYRFGQGDDAPKAEPMSGAERKRKHRDRSTLERAWRAQP
jgi:hypothetical protein